MQTVELDLEGMTCASCANRIERKLGKLDGVTATVNYATERAAIEAPDDMSVDELVQVVEQAGYGARPVSEEPRADHADELRPRMLLAFALAVPVIVVSMVPALQFPAWQWVAMVLTTVVVFWCGRSFHAAAWANLRHGSTSMDTLVSLGTLVAWLWSVIALFFGHAGHIGMRHEFTLRLERADPLGDVWFEAAAAITAFLLLGRWIEARSKQEAGAAVRALMEAGASEALVLRDGEQVRVPAGELAVGDQMVVLPGHQVPADGEVIEGHSAVDASIVTGESLPVEVSAGSQVVGGSLNTDGRLLVRATAVGSRTQVAQIARMVEQAQTGKAKAQRLADRISGFFVPAVLVISALTFLVHWALGQGVAFALTAAISVLIIACPCALGLATPSALLVGTGRGAQLGIIIRGAEALERARDIDVIALDKTGTLTTGQMTVSAVHPADGVTEDDLLRLAAAVEQGSEHPIARAITTRAADLGLKVPAATGFRTVPGQGIEATVEGQQVRVGNASFTGADGESAGTQVHVSVDGRVLGRVDVGDSLKPDAARAVAGLRELGLRPVLLTGDNAATAQRVAGEVGIDEVRAQVLPTEKAQAVAELRTGGTRVAMVGDGINDAAALATSDLGIAMNTGTDAAKAASDLTLVRDDLLAVVDAVRLSRATDRIIRSNLVWAFGYNVAAIPLAALGMLTPMIAGAAMALSSVFVVLNSLRLRGFQAS